MLSALQSVDGFYYRSIFRHGVGWKGIRTIKFQATRMHFRSFFGYPIRFFLKPYHKIILMLFIFFMSHQIKIIESMPNNYQ